MSAVGYRLGVAFIAFAALAAVDPGSASAEGLERGPVSVQPLELWSKAGSGLGALESRCDLAARSGWRVRETIDPWAMPTTPCVTPLSARPRAILEIVNPWPAGRSKPWAASHEIVDPWPLAQR